MTEHLAETLTKKLLMNGSILEDEQDLYSYTILVLIEKIIGFSAIYLIALFQGHLLETILFILCFSNLRKYTGGFHANSFAGCFIGTTGIYLAYIRLIYPYLLANRYINITAYIISAMVILILGAVNHPNMHWDKEEYREHKRYARITVLVELAAGVLFLCLRAAEKYILFMSFGMILCAVLLILGKITEEEVNYCE